MTPNNLAMQQEPVKVIKSGDTTVKIMAPPPMTAPERESTKQNIIRAVAGCLKSLI